jgi:hypothetical protein
VSGLRPHGAPPDNAAMCRSPLAIAMCALMAAGGCRREAPSADPDSPPRATPASRTDPDPSEAARAAVATVDRWIDALKARDDEAVESLLSTDFRILLVSVHQLDRIVDASVITERTGLAARMPTDFFRFTSLEDVPPDGGESPAGLSARIGQLGVDRPRDEYCPDDDLDEEWDEEWAEEWDQECDDQAPDHDEALRIHREMYEELMRRVSAGSLLHQRYSDGDVWDDTCAIVTTPDGRQVEGMLCIRATWDSGD